MFISGLRGAKHFSVAFRIVFRISFSRFSNRFSYRSKSFSGAVSFCRHAVLTKGFRSEGSRKFLWGLELAMHCLSVGQQLTNPKNKAKTWRGVEGYRREGEQLWELLSTFLPISNEKSCSKYLWKLLKSLKTSQNFLGRNPPVRYPSTSLRKNSLENYSYFWRWNLFFEVSFYLKK